MSVLLTNIPPSELPLTANSLQPNVPSQAGNPSASYQVAGQPPTVAWPDWQNLHPNIFARPNAQGIPGPLWQLFNAAVEYQGGEDLRVLIHFKKVQPQAP